MKALDLVIPVDEECVLVIVSVERGCQPNSYYCVDANGYGKWFKETEIQIAKAKVRWSGTDTER